MIQHYSRAFKITRSVFAVIFHFNKIRLARYQGVFWIIHYGTAATGPNLMDLYGCGIANRETESGAGNSSFLHGIEPVQGLIKTQKAYGCCVLTKAAQGQQEKQVKAAAEHVSKIKAFTWEGL